MNRINTIGQAGAFSHYRIHRIVNLAATYERDEFGFHCIKEFELLGILVTRLGIFTLRLKIKKYWNVLYLYVQYLCLLCLCCRIIVFRFQQWQQDGSQQTVKKQSIVLGSKSGDPASVLLLSL